MSGRQSRPVRPIDADFEQAITIGENQFRAIRRPCRVKSRREPFNAAIRQSQSAIQELVVNAILLPSGLHAGFIPTSALRVEEREVRPVAGDRTEIVAKSSDQTDKRDSLAVRRPCWIFRRSSDHQHLGRGSLWSQHEQLAGLRANTRSYCSSLTNQARSQRFLRSAS